jgi:NAD(P)-dependent dehydrogenase (short-subunit alcohol dehydrogenase family)
MAKWTASDVPDLTGRTVLVTGANSGIGFEAARVFARKGAQVVLACRHLQRGEAALQAICGESPAARLSLLELDLASLASVRQGAARFAAEHARLDVLCNNAGVMAVPRALSPDGFEMHLAVTHFGHFALTGLLIERLLQTGSARIVTVSSGMHRIGQMRWDDLEGQRRYHKWEAYGQSKLANLLFAFELQRRLQARGAGAISVACHPGYANTNLQQVGPTLHGSPVRVAFYRVANALFAQSAERGALPTLYAATAPDVRGGDYIGPDGVGEIAGWPRKVQASRAAYDAEAARRLWDVSVQRTGVDYRALA